MLEAKGHAYNGFIVVREPYLEQNGIEERACSACGKTERREFACEHSNTSVRDFGGYICPDDTEVQTFCVRCSVVLSTSIMDGTDHIFGDWQILIEATPQGDGVRYRECQKCPHFEAEMYSIDLTE